MRSLGAFIRATHPIPAIAVTAMTGALLAGRGASPRVLGLGVLSAAAGQASVGWSNDSLDAQSDARAGRMEKPVVAGEVSARILFRAALVAAAVCLSTALPLGMEPFLAMAGAVAIAWAYNLGLKATILSWLPYAVAFALLPVFAWTANGTVPPASIVVGGGILGVAGHLMNVLPDLERDRGIRGLPHRLGPAGSVALAGLLLGGGLVVAQLAGLAWRSPGGLVAGALGAVFVGASLGSARAGRASRAFNFAIAAAAAVVAVVLLSPPRW